MYSFRIFAWMKVCCWRSKFLKDKKFLRNWIHATNSSFKALCFWCTWKIFDIWNLDYLIRKNVYQSFKYHRSPTSSVKDIRICKLQFAASIQFLFWRKTHLSPIYLFHFISSFYNLLRRAPHLPHISTGTALCIGRSCRLNFLLF